MAGQDRWSSVRKIQPSGLGDGGRAPTTSASSDQPGATGGTSDYLPQWPDVEYLAHFLQEYIFNQDKCKPDGLPPSLPYLNTFPVNAQRSVKAQV